MRHELIVRVRMTAPFRGEHAGSGSDDNSTLEYRFSKLPISIGKALSS